MRNVAAREAPFSSFTATKKLAKIMLNSSSAKTAHYGIGNTCMTLSQYMKKMKDNRKGGKTLSP